MLMPAVHAPRRPFAKWTFAEPTPEASQQSFDRYHGLDLPGLSDGELHAEARFYAARIWPLSEDAWQRQRLAMLTAEINRRSRTTQAAVRPKPTRPAGGVDV